MLRSAVLRGRISALSLAREHDASAREPRGDAFPEDPGTRGSRRHRGTIHRRVMHAVRENAKTNQRHWVETIREPAQAQVPSQVSPTQLSWQPAEHL